MLTDRKDEQETLFKEIVYKKMPVREAELLARKIAVERARVKEIIVDPELDALEAKFTESLGTRVHIEKGANGGKITIDFFSNDDVRAILDIMNSQKKMLGTEMLDKHIKEVGGIENVQKPDEIEAEMLDDRTAEQKKEDETTEDLYSVKNFSL
jgi:hypothetical protein